MSRGNGKPSRKTATKTAKPALVPQPNGRGALYAGGVPGNRGNPNAQGPPPSAIRARCRGSFDQRIPVLESIADGEPTERISIPLLSVLPHVRCPRCGGETVATDPAAAALLEIQVRSSPRAGDRTKAVDALGKYGLGDATGIDADEVREKLGRSLDLIEAMMPAPLAARLLGSLKQVWDQ